MMMGICMDVWMHVCIHYIFRLAELLRHFVCSFVRVRKKWAVTTTTLDNVPWKKHYICIAFHVLMAVVLYIYKCDTPQSQLLPFLCDFFHQEMHWEWKKPRSQSIESHLTFSVLKGCMYNVKFFSVLCFMHIFYQFTFLYFTPLSCSCSSWWLWRMGRAKSIIKLEPACIIN